MGKIIEKPSNDLGRVLIDTWAEQARDGFLLSDPANPDIATLEVADPQSGVSFRFRWMPHREIRGDVAELERRGILNPDRQESKLFRDPRDPMARHCFLCEANIAECNPMETLVGVELAGRAYNAGANFSWIEPNHYTVMPREHCDQAYSRHVLDAMLDLHDKTGGQFRVLFNGPGAGATIPWHLHYQITTAALPVETLPVGAEHTYPTPVCRFPASPEGMERAHRTIERWLGQDPVHRSLNLLVATIDGQTQVFMFPRDQRYAKAEGKGLVGGFEVAGTFVLSAPAEKETFDNANAAVARTILSRVHPPDWAATIAAA